MIKIELTERGSAWREHLVGSDPTVAVVIKPVKALLLAGQRIGLGRRRPAQAIGVIERQRLIAGGFRDGQ